MADARPRRGIHTVRVGGTRVGAVHKSNCRGAFVWSLTCPATQRGRVLLGARSSTPLDGLRRAESMQPPLQQPGRRSGRCVCRGPPAGAARSTSALDDEGRASGRGLGSTAATQLPGGVGPHPRVDVSPTSTIDGRYLQVATKTPCFPRGAGADANFGGSWHLRRRGPRVFSKTAVASSLPRRWRVGVRRWTLLLARNARGHRQRRYREVLGQRVPASSGRPGSYTGSVPLPMRWVRALFLFRSVALSTGRRVRHDAFSASTGRVSHASTVPTLHLPALAGAEDHGTPGASPRWLRRSRLVLLGSPPRARANLGDRRALSASAAAVVPSLLHPIPAL